jgi:hypothetical protein
MVTVHGKPIIIASSLLIDSNVLCWTIESPEEEEEHATIHEKVFKKWHSDDMIPFDSEADD